jgi:hypothetical protein
MDNNTTAGILAWLFKTLGGRKVTIFLASYGVIIATILQAVQGHVTGPAATVIGVALAVLGLLGVGVPVAIAHEDGKKATASAMVQAASLDLQTAQAHQATAAIQAQAPAGAAPAAMGAAFGQSAL